jgi:hypothetical protein
MSLLKMATSKKVHMRKAAHPWGGVDSGMVQAWVGHFVSSITLP